MKTTIHLAELKHRAILEDVINILRKHSDHVSAIEILAVMSHLVGQLIAVQDQQKVTREMALEIVGKNIEQGNLESVSELLGKPQGSA